MKNHPWVRNILALFLIVIAAIGGLFYLKPTLSPETSHHSTDAEISEEDAFKRGPHQGRLLEHDGFEAEVTIFEPEGFPPKFRIYFYESGDPIKPSLVSYKMELQRINRLEIIPFKPTEDYLESTVEIPEPHSFKVKITAIYKEKTYTWEYQSYEGRVELSPEAIIANQIKIEEAAPINLEIQIDVMGKIMPNEEHTVFISPRFPGMVKTVNKKLGDIVKKGDILATIESNESLQNYEVKSEINGMIIKKNINLGMFLSGQENIFVISNLSSVWADFNVYSQDLSRVDVGDPIEITNLDGSIKQKATIDYISPFGQESTQSVVARAVLANPKEIWKPGLFISGKITVENVSIPVAVKISALQTYRDWDVVFIVVGNQFEVVPVKLGRRNNEWVEIKSGLKPGDRYVSKNSFILKADLEKAGAEHEH